MTRMGGPVFLKKFFKIKKFDFNRLFEMQTNRERGNIYKTDRDKHQQFILKVQKALTANKYLLKFTNTF